MQSEEGATLSSQEEQDLKDIALAHRYRLSLTTSPTQSSFRVVAIVFYKDTFSSFACTSDPPFPVANNTSQDKRQYVVGTNDEPGGFIGGSICAERAALVQLRFLPNSKVTKIVIVTDHTKPISPGMLCREFMAGHAAVPWDVLIVLAGSKHINDGGDYVITKTTLRQLHPYPSPYARLTAPQANEFGTTFAKRKAERKNEEEIIETTVAESSVRQLMIAAQKASLNDTLTSLHPIQYGAAVLLDDGTIVSGHQKKALEYGATLDAVSQLVPLIEQSVARPVALVQVDANGIAHAPFASARAYLSEHGYGDCRILVHANQQVESSKDDAIATHIGELVDVVASDLAPDAPDMGNLWSC